MNIVLCLSLILIGVCVSLAQPVDDLCPPDSIVQCYVDPCLGRRCPRYPQAECIATYCFRCSFRFSLNGMPVKCYDGPGPPQGP
ncbi:unnamed protein product [Gordionus sp. m RMFG-2023]